MYSLGQDKRPHTTVRVKGREVIALVDTGAQITAVGKNHVQTIQDWGNKLQESQCLLTMANQSEQSTLGQIDVEYSWDGTIRTVPTIILDSTTNHLILGVDFLNRFNIKTIPLSLNSPVDISVVEQPTRHAMALIDSFKSELTEQIRFSDPNKPKTRVHKLRKVRATFQENEHTQKFEKLTAERFLEWLNFDNEQEEVGLSTLDSTVSTSNTSQTDSIYHNLLVTSEGIHDMERDLESPKVSPVTLPHVLSDDQKEILDSVLRLFIHTNLEGKLNKTHAISHIIDTGDAKPIMRRQYPMSPIQLEKVQKELDKMVALGIVTEISYSPWRSPILAVGKKDGGVRVCLDARELNKVTVPNAYPIMDTNSILAQLKTTKYMSSIDLSQAFHQVPLDEDSQEKTAFAIGGKMMCYKRMTMGLRNSPATLAILIDRIFRDLHPFAFAYVDDFIICSETFEHHVQLLTTIAHRLAKFGLTISPSKSNFCCSQLEFLGYILTEKGLTANPTRVDPIRQFPRPTCVKDVRRFVGAATWYRRFVHGFAEIVAPLNALITTKRKTIEWNDQAEKAFVTIKDRLSNPPILAMCDYTKPFKIYTDASDVAGAAVLVQSFDEQGERPICYYSFKFTATQQKYSATERECLAVIATIEKFRPYIEGSKFEIVTDHSALQWLMSTKDLKGRIARWSLRLQVYIGDMTIIHRKGAQMEFPDALSRVIPPIPTSEEINVITINPETRDRWYRKILKKHIKVDSEQYKTTNGLLYYHRPFDSYSGERQWVLCVPEEQRRAVLHEHHDEYSHMGVWKVIWGLA